MLRSRRAVLVARDVVEDPPHLRGTAQPLGPLRRAERRMFEQLRERVEIAGVEKLGVGVHERGDGGAVFVHW